MTHMKVNLAWIRQGILLNCCWKASLPIPEPSVFNGNPLKYSSWKSEFNTLLSGECIKTSEMIYYLKRYLSGPAKADIESTIYLAEEKSFTKAIYILDSRYGNNYIVAEAFRDKIQNWKRIQAKDYKGLQLFVDFLKQCEIASEGIPTLSILDDIRENRNICNKLPEWLILN